VISTGFWIPVLVTAGLNALLALSVYITLLSGQASMGHAAFAGIGAYAAAILTRNFNFPFPVAIAVSMLIGLLVGGILSLATMRMSELVVALTTIGFAETMVVLAYNIPYLGGAQSFSGIHPVTTIWHVYGALAIVMYVVWRLDHSRIGLAARAIRANRVAASAMGINVPWVRILTFALGGLVAGLAGALSAHYTLVVNPDDMSFFHSFTFKMFVLFGGSYLMQGPVAGAMILTILPEILRLGFSLSDKVSGSVRLVAYGLIIILIVIRRPQGLLQRTPTGVSRPRPSVRRWVISVARGIRTRLEPAR
jgi:branched-chain amino acid transport system permease protein